MSVRFDEVFSVEFVINTVDRITMSIQPLFHTVCAVPSCAAEVLPDGLGSVAESRKPTGCTISCRRVVPTQTLSSELASCDGAHSPALSKR